ncbi:zinc finger CCCH domain protein [Perilla frutescens var. hirtella]|uniref:Zinc finger CCCH domain protein n=1 Tax=Perilla frutescens var. hirtella TaxID=608512 RepID=A0AAD4J622_PERFH|nr:zinc finger CCCH domain protein [Perilla frutescens var. hirtella]
MGEEAEKNQELAKPTKNPSPNSITETQFAAWKRRKDADASARKDAAARKREEDIAAGVVQMNGRELFEREPWVFDNTHY